MTETETFKEIRRASIESAIQLTVMKILLIEKGLFTNEEFEAKKQSIAPLMDQLIAALCPVCGTEPDPDCQICGGAKL